MIDSTPCPDASTLFRLRIGKIPDPLASQLREHLAACPKCARSPGGSSQGSHRLKTAQSGGSPAGGSTAVATPRPSGAGGLLRPPERPDELGRLGGYRVLRLLGEDGAGCVYEAEHPRQGVRVAMQVIPARTQAAERARQRAQSGSDGAYEVGEDNGALFVVTTMPGAHPAARTARGPRYCPRCLGDLREVGGKEWCAKCGYSSDDDDQQSPQADPGPQGVPYWMFVFLAGCFAIVVATVMRRELLPDGSMAQIWWILYQAGAGLLAYFVGHVLIVVLTFRHWRDGELFKYIDPLTAAKYAIEFLPRTRYGICLAVWGAIAFMCAFILFWMNDFAFKDKKAKKTIVVHGVLSTGEGATVPEDPEAGDFVIYGDAVLVENVGEARDVNLIDPYGDPDPPERQEPPNVTTCVVIGYVPDPNDPDRVGQLVLGTRDADGTIRYAGTVSNFVRSGEVDQGVTQVKGLTPLLEKPGYLPDGLNVIPVEPSMSARIAYQERDARGELKNATIRGFGKPDGTTP